MTRRKLDAFPNSVALAIFVIRMPTCQAARSAAKKRPAKTMTAIIRREGAEGPVRSRRAMKRRKGTASAMRQKPEATGPTSASRTSHGPKASIRFAASSAGKAKRAARAAEGDRIWCMPSRGPLGVAAHCRQGAPMPTLFEPLQLGALLCPNRIVMAPLTRGRATREHVPTALMADYYAQRASAGLIITEATGIGRQG